MIDLFLMRLMNFLWLGFGIEIGIGLDIGTWYWDLISVSGVVLHWV